MHALVLVSIILVLYSVIYAIARFKRTHNRTSLLASVLVSLFCLALSVWLVQRQQPASTSEVANSTENQKTTVSTSTTTEVTQSNLASSTTKATYKQQVGYTTDSLYVYGAVDKKLVLELENVLDSYNKDISIVCWSTDGSKVLEYNTEKTYFSACTVKMPVMYSYCKLADEGIIDFNKEIVYSSRHYYKGSGDIRYQPYGTKYTVKQLVNKSLSISDNVAYVMLLDEYGKAPVNNLMTKLDCPSIKLTSASKWAKQIKACDLARVWCDIYQYFCSDSENAKVLKEACTNTPYNYGTKQITEYDYSHKSGDNFGEFMAYNDAGIVWSDTPYIYVVLTKSEGTAYDRNTVDSVMGLVNKIMTATD